jgi:hypothetical protein
MSAVSTLRYLTSNIVKPTEKEYLRETLRASLVTTKDYDLPTVERALDHFFGTGLKAV